MEEYVKTVIAILNTVSYNFQETSDYKKKREIVLLKLLDFIASELDDTQVTFGDIYNALSPKATGFLEFWFCDKDDLCPDWCENYDCDCDCNNELAETLKEYEIVANNKKELNEHIIKNYTQNDFKELLLDYLGQPYVDYSTDQIFETIKQILK